MNKLTTMGACVFLGLCATGGAASADMQVAASASHPTGMRREVTVGMLLGSYRLGGPKGFAGGVELGMGARWRSAELRGEYEILRVGDDSGAKAVKGTMNRLGAALRYDLLGASNNSDVEGWFWLEGGVGHEWTNWDHGGLLERNDVSFGFGVQPMFRGKNEMARKYLGYVFAFRGFIANDPNGNLPGAVATCAGPCTKATKAGYDMGFFFNMSFAIGK